MQNKNRSAIIGQNISYHDEVAESYNAIMEQDKSNEPVRRRVKEKLLTILPSGRVLDFGGGTGLDLEWLTLQDYDIIFCEPSVAMREKAVEYNRTVLHSNRVTFLQQEATHFSTWGETAPFPGKVDAVLSDFGPVNYIPDIDLLFDNLSRIIKPGGHILLLILELGFRSRLKWHRRNALRSLLFRTPFVIYIPYKEQWQTVVVHTVGEIRKASAPYFRFSGSESLPGANFTLIHLVRK